MRIEAYSARWQQKLTCLTDRVFGTGFLAHPSSQLQGDPESCVFVAIDGEKEVAGFARGRLLARGGLGDFLEHRLVEIPEDLDKADGDGVLGVIETVVVAPKHRGKGLGTKLLRIVHDTVVGLGADKLIVTFKRGPRAEHVDRLMEKLGFELWLALDSYWRRRCDRGDFVCLEREEVCDCKAMFYRKKIF